MNPEAAIWLLSPARKDRTSGHRKKELACAWQLDPSVSPETLLTTIGMGALAMMVEQMSV